MNRISGHKVDTLYKIARAGKSKSNALRNLRTVLNSTNVMLPVRMDAVKLTVVKRKPKIKRLEMWWPILRMRDWVQTLLEEYPRVLLCGYCKEDTGWKQVLEHFWQQFYETNPDHEIYRQASSSRPLSCCVPYYIHGDEGRFLRNKPLMIESFQPAISHKGLNYTNESGHLAMR